VANNKSSKKTHPRLPECKLVLNRSLQNPALRTLIEALPHERRYLDLQPAAEMMKNPGRGSHQLERSLQQNRQGGQSSVA